jgi:hypothetical protein
MTACVVVFGGAAAHAQQPPAASPHVAALQPPPPSPEAPPVPPPSPAAPANAAPGSADPARPQAEPIEQLGDARWSEGLGFVQPAPAAQEPAKDQASDGGLFTVPAVGEVGLNAAEFRIGIGSMTLNPTNDDGRTADDTAMTVLDIPMDLRLEFRHLQSFIAPWLDAGVALHVGERNETVGSTETGRVMGVGGFRLRGRFGIDLHPAPMFGGGPFVGYGRDFYDASVKASESSVEPESDLESDGGLLYGLHARFRTKETPTERARFYADGAFTFRNAEHITGQYLSLELGLRAGDVYFLAWLDRRMGASGSFSFNSPTADATSLSQAVAKSMPIEQRLGLGLSLLM